MPGYGLPDLSADFGLEPLKNKYQHFYKLYHEFRETIIHRILWELTPEEFKSNLTEYWKEEDLVMEGELKFSPIETTLKIKDVAYGKFSVWVDLEKIHFSFEPFLLKELFDDTALKH